MKQIFKKMICVLMALCLTVSLLSTTAFALKYNRNEQIKYLSEQEKYDYIWKSFTYGQEYEISKCKERDDFLTLSIARAELKSFVSTLDISPHSSTDYTVSMASGDFTEYLHKKYGNIMPYSEEVIKYMKSHPDADLEWTYNHDKDNYTVDDNPFWDCTVEYTGIYMQYSDNDVSKILIWTYDKNSDKYICKDQNGKIVNSVAKYHIDTETPSSLNSDNSKNTTEYSAVSSTTETAYADISGNVESIYVYTDSTVSALPETTEPYTAAAAEETQIESWAVEVTDNNGVNVQNIILIVLGVLIIVGIIVIIVMLKKKVN
ncbi:MAG: hypothetical protein PUG48_06660 [Clostridia bacterium]|nr:hypothetical protein [Clostridia bacterium]